MARYAGLTRSATETKLSPDSDLLEACLATARGELRGAKLAWKPEPCVSVVMAGNLAAGR